MDRKQEFSEGDDVRISEGTETLLLVEDDEMVRKLVNESSTTKAIDFGSGKRRRGVIDLRAVRRADSSASHRCRYA